MKMDLMQVSFISLFLISQMLISAEKCSVYHDYIQFCESSVKYNKDLSISQNNECSFNQTMEVARTVENTPDILITKGAGDLIQCYCCTMGKCFLSDVLTKIMITNKYTGTEISDNWSLRGLRNIECFSKLINNGVTNNEIFWFVTSGIFFNGKIQALDFQFDLSRIFIRILQTMKKTKSIILVHKKINSIIDINNLKKIISDIDDNVEFNLPLTEFVLRKEMADINVKNEILGNWMSKVNSALDSLKTTSQTVSSSVPLIGGLSVPISPIITILEFGVENYKDEKLRKRLVINTFIIIFINGIKTGKIVKVSDVKRLWNELFSINFIDLQTKWSVCLPFKKSLVNKESFRLEQLLEILETMDLGKTTIGSITTSSVSDVVVNSQQDSEIIEEIKRLIENNKNEASTTPVATSVLVNSAAITTV